MHLKFKRMGIDMSVWDLYQACSCVNASAQVRTHHSQVRTHHFQKKKNSSEMNKRITLSVSNHIVSNCSDSNLYIQYVYLIKFKNFIKSLPKHHPKFKKV